MNDRILLDLAGTAKATFTVAGIPVLTAASIPVVSVNGQTGAVVLDATDVGADVAGAAATVAGNLTTHEALTTTAHGGIVASTDPRLTDARTPTAHATTHQNGGTDEIATSTPAANAIPKANGSALLDSWISADSIAGTASLRKLGTGSTDACAGNDARLSDTRTPTDATVSLAKFANFSANSILGNNTGSPATPAYLTGAQVTAMLSAFVGDSGSGGTQGLVPAPAAGDGAAGKFLAATGLWTTVSTGSATWGMITGTLSSQTDLQTALNLKANTSSLAAIATSGSATDLSTGTLPAARMVALTGDVTNTVGTVATTITAASVTLAKMANLAANSIIGNNTGSPATPIALTVTQATAMLNAFVGDSGSGGTKGLVIAPATGDATKFLRGDATWQTVSSSAAWGSITGTLSAQTDLQSALNLKANLTANTFTATQTVDIGSGSNSVDVGGAPMIKLLGNTNNSTTNVYTWGASDCYLLSSYASSGNRATPSALTNGNAAITITGNGYLGVSNAFRALGTIKIVSDGNLINGSTGGGQVIFQQMGTDGSTVSEFKFARGVLCVGIGTNNSPGSTGLLQVGPSSSTTSANGIGFSQDSACNIYRNGSSILKSDASWIINGTGVASVPGLRMDGAWFTGGTATTTKPHVLIEGSGATSTGWSTLGTGLGINAINSFTGNLIDLQTNGVSIYKIKVGTVVAGAVTTIISDRVTAAFSVGLNGATNPAFQIDTSASNSVTGLQISSGAAGAGVTVSTIGNGSNEKLILSALGNSNVQLRSGGGNIALAPNASDRYTFGNTSFTLTPGAVSGGTVAGFVYTPGADTALTTTVGVPDVDFAIDRTKQWASGTVALQKFIRFRQPTMSFIGASTCTDAATFYIDGAPVAGTNATITNPWALFVNGATKITGALALTGTTFGAFSATPTTQQTGAGGTITNNVSPTGSTTNQYDDFTNGTVYATDYASLHNTIAQLCRIQKLMSDALRNYGFLT